MQIQHNACDVVKTCTFACTEYRYKKAFVTMSSNYLIISYLSSLQSQSCLYYYMPVGFSYTISFCAYQNFYQHFVMHRGITDYKRLFATDLLII